MSARLDPDKGQCQYYVIQTKHINNLTRFIQNLPHSDILTRKRISQDFSLLSIEVNKTMGDHLKTLASSFHVQAAV
jgi:hypothetical protein